MAVTTSEVKRKLMYDGSELTDIPGLNISELQDHYSREHPEILNSKIIEGDIIKGVRTYEFKVINGVKG